MQANLNRGYNEQYKDKDLRNMDYAFDRRRQVTILGFYPRQKRALVTDGKFTRVVKTDVLQINNSK